MTILLNNVVRATIQQQNLDHVASVQLAMNVQVAPTVTKSLPCARMATSRPSQGWQLAIPVPRVTTVKTLPATLQFAPLGTIQVKVTMHVQLVQQASLAQMGDLQVSPLVQMATTV